MTRLNRALGLSSLVGIEKQVGALEAELAGVDRSRASLEARLPAAKSERDTAVAARRAALVEGQGENRAVKQRALAATLDLEAVEDALADLGRKREEIEARLATARRKASNEREAAEIERRATVLDGARQEVTNIVARLETVAKTIKDSAPAEPDDLFSAQAPNAIAAHFISEILHRQMAWLFDSRWNIAAIGGPGRPSIDDRLAGMRDRARGLRVEGG